MIARHRPDDVDVIIVGGGIVGGVLAALLSEQGFSIAIVDSNPGNSPSAKIGSHPDKVDPRVFAITRASEQVFRAAGIWDSIQDTPCGHFRDMHVWDANGRGSIHFHSSSLCQPTLGYIVENRVIQDAINQRLHGLGKIHYHCPGTLEQLDVLPDHIKILLDDGTRISGRLIVGADGAQSRVRQLAAIENSTEDYRQTALVCTVKSQVAHKDTARQRFMCSGPLAFLPLADQHLCSIVWSNTPEQANTLAEISEPEFHSSLEQAFDNTLGKVLETGPRYTFPLQRAHTKNYVKQRIALVGDAAHRVHPLAGQGANLGIIDAACLAEILTRHQQNDVGSMAVLRQYERWRKGENLSIMMAMDGFKHLFCTTNPVLKRIRNYGLNATDSKPVIKRLIMERAMGLTGDLPKVAQTPDFL